MSLPELNVSLAVIGQSLAKIGSKDVRSKHSKLAGEAQQTVNVSFQEKQAISAHFQDM